MGFQLCEPLDCSSCTNRFKSSSSCRRSIGAANEWSAGLVASILLPVVAAMDGVASTRSSVVSTAVGAWCRDAAGDTCCGVALRCALALLLADDGLAVCCVATAGVLLTSAFAFRSRCLVGATDVDITVSENVCAADAEDDGDTVVGVVLSVWLLDVVKGCPTDGMSRRSRGRLLCCCDWRGLSSAVAVAAAVVVDAALVVSMLFVSAVVGGVSVGAEDAVAGADRLILRVGVAAGCSVLVSVGGAGVVDGRRCTGLYTCFTAD